MKRNKIYTELQDGWFYVTNDQGTHSLKFVGSNPHLYKGYVYFYDENGKQYNALEFAVVEEGRLQLKNDETDYGLWLVTKANEIYPIDSNVIPFIHKEK